MASNLPPSLGPQTTNSRRQEQDLWARLDQACMPANPAVLDQIQDQLAAGQYSSSLELRSDLQADLGLLFYMYKRLADHCADRSLHLLRTIDQQPLTRLQALLPESADRISKLELSALSPTQSNLLQDSVEGCFVAEALANEFGKNLERGYDAAACYALRQLGINLVALSFHENFEQALGQGLYAEKLDIALKAKIEMSPLSAGLQIAMQMRCDLGLLRAARISSDQASKAKFDDKELAIALPRICFASETFMNLRRYPHIAELKNAWNAQLTELKNYLNIKSSQSIEDRIQKYLEQRLTIQRKAITRVPSPAKQERELLDYVSKHNVLLSKCPNITIDLLKPVYQILSQGEPDLMQALMTLVNTVPKLGFPRGCLFAAPSDNWRVESIVSIGDWQGERFEELEKWRKALVIAAVGDQAAQRRDGVLKSGLRASYVSGSVGPDANRAALLLEIDNEYFDTEDPFAAFRALQKVFHSCLGG